MKWMAVIVLLAIALSIVIPPSLSMMIADKGHSRIGTLDVCHSAAPALSSDGDMPCMNETVCRPLRLAVYEVSRISSPRCKSLFIAFQEERPPKV